MGRVATEYSYEFLHQCFKYNAFTGVVVWKERPLHHFQSKREQSGLNKRYAGKVAGATNAYGYITSCLRGHRVMMHRVAWVMTYGNIGEFQLDHINGIRTDNRIDNLRPVDNQENHKNMKLFSTNTSGVPGVSWDKRTRRWRVQIRHCGKWIYLGRFECFQDAVVARSVANEKYGFHQNHGRAQS